MLIRNLMEAIRRALNTAINYSCLVRLVLYSTRSKVISKPIYMCMHIIAPIHTSIPNAQPILMHLIRISTWIYSSPLVDWNSVCDRKWIEFSLEFQCKRGLWQMHEIMYWNLVIKLKGGGGSIFSRYIPSGFPTYRRGFHSAYHVIGNSNDFFN